MSVCWRYLDRILSTDYFLSSSGHTEYSCQSPSLQRLSFLSPHSAPFPTMNRTSVANRVTRHSANFRSVIIRRNIACARRCLKLHSAFGSHSRGRQFLCLYFSRWNETTNNAKRGIPFSPWRSMLECDLKVDEYETKWFVGKINGEYLRSVSFFFVQHFIVDTLWKRERSSNRSIFGGNLRRESAHGLRGWNDIIEFFVHYAIAFLRSKVFATVRDDLLPRSTFRGSRIDPSLRPRYGIFPRRIIIHSWTWGSEKMESRFLVNFLFLVPSIKTRVGDHSVNFFLP